MKKIRVLGILLLTLILAFCATFSACDPSVQNEVSDDGPLVGGTKAIIMVHGILGGQLYNEESGQYLWDFFTTDIDDCQDGSNLMNAVKKELDENAMDFIKILNDIIGDEEDSVLAQMLSDEDGNLLYPTTVAYPDSDTRRRYGGFAAYKDTVLQLEERYGEEYEVKFFNYNWLVDVREAALELEKFINENNYTEIILISHSMGGLVTTSYLTKQQNRRRVAKNILICSPLYGSMYAVDALESHDYFGSYIEVFKSLLKLITFANIGNGLAELLDRMKDSLLNKLITNTTTVFQLLPSPELIEYYPNMIALSEDNYVTADELYSFYSKRVWAKKEEGGIKGTLVKYQELRDSLYVIDNGEKIFASELVDSYYIGGIEHYTAYGADYNKNYSMRYVPDGDGTVLYRSATLGKDPDGEHVFAVDCSHGIATSLSGECADIVFSIIEKK